MGALGNTDAWDANEYILLRNDTQAYWDGDAWAEGRAPGAVIAATGANAGTPGTFTPTGAEPPADLGTLDSVTANPTTAWTAGQRVILGDGTAAYWNGTAWVAGTAP
jgi:hypothetical protein